MISARIRVFNKYVINRILGAFAHLPRGPFGLVRHVGRRSGKPYETVLMVWPMGEGFVIALTYGPRVDWYRNLLAAGGGAVYWHRRTYRVGTPELIGADVALPAFPPPVRQILRGVGMRNFARLRLVQPATARGETAARP